MRGGKKKWDDANDSKLKGLVGDLIVTGGRLNLHAKNIGACMNVQGTTVTGTILLAMESRDFLCSPYNVTPPLPTSRTTAMAVSFTLV